MLIYIAFSLQDDATLTFIKRRVGWGYGLACENAVSWTLGALVSGCWEGEL